MLKITDQSGKIYYGGNQEWYSSNTRAMAGCSSVAAANALRVLSQKDINVKRIIYKSKKLAAPCKAALIKKECTKNDFIMLMTDMYNTMGSMEIFPLNRIYDKSERSNKLFRILKPNNGRSSIGFIAGMLLYSKRIGLDLSYEALPTAFVSQDIALSFIKAGLKESGSVVLLTSYNKHPIKMYSPSHCDVISQEKLFSCACSNADMKCHFATITGINGSNLIITTWGNIASVSIDELVQSWQSIKAFESTLFYFKKSTRLEMIKSLFTCSLPFIKGIIQAIRRKQK